MDLRRYFNRNYRGSDFSRDFLEEKNVRELLTRISRTSADPSGLEERVANFIVSWDESRGYNNTERMLKDAQDAFVFQEAERASKDDWKNKFQIIHPLTDDILKPLRRVSDRRARRQDNNRTASNDSGDSIVSSAARCRILRTPYRGNVIDGSYASDASCARGEESNDTTIPFRTRKESLAKDNHFGRLAGRRLRRYF